MQNVDFYERRNNRVREPYFNDLDPEFFPRLAHNKPREIDRIRKKASRTFFLISSLCIISFTAGIIIGIKFAAGTPRDIVDKKTFTAVTDIGKKISNIIAENPSETASRENPFPKKNYPYVIKLRSDYDQATSRKIADFLSHKGHTVIITRYDNSYRIFIGPYKNSDDAESAVKKISGYQKYSLAEILQIIKR
jgi:SPOR domain